MQLLSCVCWNVHTLLSHKSFVSYYVQQCFKDQFGCLCLWSFSFNYCIISHGMHLPYSIYLYCHDISTTTNIMRTSILVSILYMSLCKSFSDIYLRKTMTELQGLDIFYFSNTSFQNSYNHLYFCQQGMRIPIYPYLAQHLLSSMF